MKKVIGVSFLFFAGLVQAATVTIDFEEFSVGSTGPLQSNGYTIDGYGYGFGGGPGTVAAPGNYFRVAAGDNGSFGVTLEISINRTDNSAFAMYSMDALGVFSGNILPATITGQLAGGGTITGALGDLGSGGWLNIVSAQIDWSHGPSPFSFEGGIDNIVVGAAVPVPAAVWLFTSALAGLGLMRRR